MDDHHDVFFVPKVESMCEPYGPSPADIDRKFHMMDERFKAREGHSTFGLDAVDMCLVPEVKIPTKFKVPAFEKYKGTTCLKTHTKSFCKKMTTYSDDEKLLMQFFQDILSETSLEWYMQLQHGHVRTWRELVDAFLRYYQYNTNNAPNSM